MFNGLYEDRLRLWTDFRNTLETTETPLQDIVDFYNTPPRVTIHTDPYDQSTWPSPWELVAENIYCDFCILLGICYSLQLTDRFSSSNFEIHITQDREKSETHYLLFVDEWCIGYDSNKPVLRTELSKTMTFGTSYIMPSLQ